MSRQRKSFCSAGVAACLLLAMQAGTAHALELSWTGQPDTHAFILEKADLDELGELHFGIGFGMTVDEVRGLLARAHPEVSVVEQVEPVQLTRVLTVVVPDLEPMAGIPSPGDATINYVFGAQSQQLIAVNFDWYADADTDTDAMAARRDALLAAGTAYVARLAAYQWAPLQSARGHVVAANGVVLFAGRDDNGGGVEVRADGIALDVRLPDGRHEHRPAAGTVRLHVGLAAQPDRPDIFRLPPNSF